MPAIVLDDESCSNILNFQKCPDCSQPRVHSDVWQICHELILKRLAGVIRSDSSPSSEEFGRLAKSIDENNIVLVNWLVVFIVNA